MQVRTHSYLVNSIIQYNNNYNNCFSQFSEMDFTEFDLQYEDKSLPFLSLSGPSTSQDAATPLTVDLTVVSLLCCI